MCVLCKAWRTFVCLTAKIISRRVSGGDARATRHPGGGTGACSTCTRSSAMIAVSQAEAR